MEKALNLFESESYIQTPIVVCMHKLFRSFIDDNLNTLNFDLWNWTLIDDVTCNWLGDEIQGLRLQAVFMQLFTGVVSIL